MAARSGPARWVEGLPVEAFFRAADVPGPSRSAVSSFLSREVARPVPRILRVAPNLYCKARPPNRFTGKVYAPDWVSIGWEIAGPHAAALGWFGAHLVRWSTQIALQYVEFAVPGEPAQRNPHPRVTIRSRRNLSRRGLTRFEATHIEAVIAFDRTCEIGWDEALELSEFHLGRRAARGGHMPRAEVVERVAAHEQPHGSKLFRARMAELVAVMDACDMRASASAEATTEAWR